LWLGKNKYLPVIAYSFGALNRLGLNIGGFLSVISLNPIAIKLNQKAKNFL
tara:strand:- start:379 stop:531 length:153 start_codon:yes stop_codon:yes gene_type:complete